MRRKRRAASTRHPPRPLLLPIDSEEPHLQECEDRMIENNEKGCFTVLTDSEGLKTREGKPEGSEYR